MRYLLTTAVLAVSLALVGCAQDKSVGKFRVGKAYDIKGKTYYPQESYTREQTGIASWYGPGFHGRKTANGERFDQNGLTAAHPTLQMPSLVRVTNLENGKTLVVRVNDRGPFHSNRIIDLSKGAAEELGIIATGTANVRVQVLGPESKALAAAAKQGVDTRRAEVAVNETGRLGPQFASFYPTLVAAPQPDVMVAASGFQPGLPAGAHVEAQTLAVPADMGMAAMVEPVVVDTIDPVASVIAAEQQRTMPSVPPVPSVRPVAQNLPPKHKTAAIFQMAPVAEEGASDTAAIRPLALASEEQTNYMPANPKFLGMRPVVDDTRR